MSKRVRYFYHPESDCYVSMSSSEYIKACKGVDGQCLEELTAKEYHHRKADQEASMARKRPETALPHDRRQDKPVEDKPDVYRVSQSKVKTYRRCRHAYHLKYVEKLSRRKKSRPLMFGGLVHKMLEADANGDDPMAVLDAIDVRKMKLFATEKQELVEIIEDVRSIMVEYFGYWEENSEMTYIRKAGRSAEHHFEIELFPGIIWNGKIDVLGRTPNKLKWMVEHKTFNRRPSDDDRWRNLQSVSYFRAIDMLGWPSVDGTCWDYIWSKAPVKPGLLQDGKMSQKRLDTMPSTVIKAVKDYGLEPLDYKKYIDSTEANRAQWFQRIHTPVNKEVADQVFAEFADTVQEMAANHGLKQDRNIERHCSWCDYEPLCRAKLQGHDWEFIKEREYETNQKRDDEAAAKIHTLSFEDIEDNG